MIEYTLKEYRTTSGADSYSLRTKDDAEEPLLRAAVGSRDIRICTFSFGRV